MVTGFVVCVFQGVTGVFVVTQFLKYKTLRPFVCENTCLKLVRVLRYFFLYFSHQYEKDLLRSAISIYSLEIIKISVASNTVFKQLFGNCCSFRIKRLSRGWEKLKSFPLWCYFI